MYPEVERRPGDASGITDFPPSFQSFRADSGAGGLQVAVQSSNHAEASERPRDTRRVTHFAPNCQRLFMEALCPLEVSLRFGEEGCSRDGVCPCHG